MERLRGDYNARREGRVKAGKRAPDRDVLTVDVPIGERVLLREHARGRRGSEGAVEDE